MIEIVGTIKTGIMRVYNATHWFTDKEAWGVFRFFAISEAISWSLLIGSIIYRRMGLPEAPSVVSFAGHIHGIVFVCYFLIVFILARSMQWGIWRIGLGVIAGMPPFGSIVFEQIMARHRKKHPVYVAPPAGADE